MFNVQKQAAIIGGSAEDEIMCIHPSCPRLVGTEPIRTAFDGMFSNGRPRAWSARIEVLTDQFQVS